MPKIPADHRSVLLLDPGLVVLPVGAGTGELNAPVGAVFGDGVAVNTLSLSESTPRTGKGSCTAMPSVLPLPGTALWPAAAPPRSNRCRRRLPPGCRRRNRPCCPRNGPPSQFPNNPVQAYSSRQRCEPGYVGRGPDCVAVCDGWAPWPSLAGMAMGAADYQSVQHSGPRHVSHV